MWSSSCDKIVLSYFLTYLSKKVQSHEYYPLPFSSLDLPWFLKLNQILPLPTNKLITWFLFPMKEFSLAYKCSGCESVVFGITSLLAPTQEVQPGVGVIAKHWGLPKTHFYEWINTATPGNFETHPLSLV